MSLHQSKLVMTMAAVAVVLSVASPTRAAGVDDWATQNLALGKTLAEVRRSLGTHADEVITERIVIDPKRPLLGRTGPTVAMVLFDHAARHERMVLFKETHGGPVVDAVVHDARLSWSYRSVFHDARYQRQFNELERQLAPSLGPSYERHLERTVHMTTFRDFYVETEGVYELHAGKWRFLLRPFGGSLEDYAPVRVFTSRDGTALGYIVLVGNGLSRAFAHRWRKEADGRFIHEERLTPTELGP
ncbi:hypothetical protein D3C72_436530 [compost metagenome]